MAVRVELVEFGYELLDIFVAYLFDRIVTLPSNDSSITPSLY